MRPEVEEELEAVLDTRSGRGTRTMSIHSGKNTGKSKGGERRGARERGRER